MGSLFSFDYSRSTIGSRLVCQQDRQGLMHNQGETVLKDAQAQVDGCGIERVNGLIQLHRKAVAGVKLAGGLD